MEGEHKDIEQPLLEKHSHHHSEGHGHSEPHNPMKVLLCVSLICFVFFVGEVIGGLIANSLTILSDAAHMFGDLSGFFIAMASIKIAKLPADETLSYGYHRAEVIGAMVSVISIWLLTVWLLTEAIHRIQYPQEVDGLIMMITAIFGLVVNLVMGKILHKYGYGHAGHKHVHAEDEEHDHEEHGDHDHEHEETPKQIWKSFDQAAQVNIRAAMLHVIGDTLLSVGVTISSIVIYFEPTYLIADPLCTFLFAIIVLITTRSVFQDCIRVLMEGTPVGISLAAITADLKAIPGVLEIHDLHVWSLSLGKPACLSTQKLPTEPRRQRTQLTCARISTTYTTTHPDRRPRRRGLRYGYSLPCGVQVTSNLRYFH